MDALTLLFVVIILIVSIFIIICTSSLRIEKLKKQAKIATDEFKSAINELNKIQNYRTYHIDRDGKLSSYRIQKSK
jgi:competence protein ComGC